MNLKTAATTAAASAAMAASRRTEEEEPAGYYGRTKQSVLIASMSLLFLIAILVVAQRKVERTQGKVIAYHVIFAIFSAICIILFPDVIAIDIFSPLSVAVVGTGGL